MYKVEANLIIEGGNANGKSTQVRALLKACKDSGIICVHKDADTKHAFHELVHRVIDERNLDPDSRARKYTLQRFMVYNSIQRQALLYSSGVDLAVYERWMGSILVETGKHLDVQKKVEFENLFESVGLPVTLPNSLTILLKTPPDVAARRSRTRNKPRGEVEEEVAQMNDDAFMQLAERENWEVVDELDAQLVHNKIVRLCIFYLGLNQLRAVSDINYIS